MSKIFCKDRTVQRTDDLNIEGGCNFQKVLYLLSVFPYDSDKVSSCFIIPGFLYIQRAEFAKSVSGKKYFIGTVISSGQCTIGANTKVS